MLTMSIVLIAVIALSFVAAGFIAGKGTDCGCNCADCTASNCNNKKSKLNFWSFFKRNDRGTLNS